MAFALLFAASSAQAEYLVPEGNSAVNQYTQGVPSAGGQKGFRSGESLNGASPTKKLGKDNAEKLTDQGSEGREVAEIAAETAPEEVAVETTEEPSQQSGDDSGKKKSKAKQQAKAKKEPKAKSDGKQEKQEAGAPASGGGPPQPNGGSGSSADGSSATGGILAAATGAEDGHLGLLLPAIVIAALLGGVIFALRDRARPTEG